MTIEAQSGVGLGEAIALVIEHVRARLRQEVNDPEQDYLAEARAQIQAATAEEVLDSIGHMEGSHWAAIEADPDLRDQLRHRVEELLADPDLCERTAQEGARRRRVYG